MECTKCGFGNREGRKFCANCGTPMMQVGVGYGGGDLGGDKGSAPPLPTVPESGNSGQVQMGGAAAPTVQEGAEPVPRVAPMGGGAPRTVLHDEVSKPLAGWLVVLRSRSMPPYREIPVFQGSNILGRDPARGQQFIDDSNASVEHALLIADAAGVQLTDMGSANGTAVNGSPVQSVALAHGDRVKIGKTTFLFLPLPPMVRTS